jgi:uridine kinase
MVENLGSIVVANSTLPIRPVNLEYKDAIKCIADRLLEMSGQGDVVLLKIVGLDASGKSTVRRRLMDVLGRDNTTFLNLTGYLSPRDERQKKGWSPFHPHAFNSQKASEHLDRLLTTGELESPVYSHVSGNLQGTERICLPDSNRRIVITDECLAVHCATMACRTMVLYVFADERVRLQRRYKRDPQERRYPCASYIEADFAAKLIDYRNHLMPLLANLDMALDTSRLPHSVDLYL